MLREAIELCRRNVTAAGQSATRAGTLRDIDALVLQAGLDHQPADAQSLDGRQGAQQLEADTFNAEEG